MPLYEEEHYGYITYLGFHLEKKKKFLEVRQPLNKLVIIQNYYNLFFKFYIEFMRLATHMFCLFFIRKPRNFCVGLTDVFEQTLVYNTFCQYLAYALWQRRLAAVWGLMVHLFLEPITVLQNIVLI